MFKDYLLVWICKIYRVDLINGVMTKNAYDFISLGIITSIVKLYFVKYCVNVAVVI